MTAIDPFDIAFARRAPEPLRTFNEAGVLEAADVHVAERLLALAGETEGAVALAAAHYRADALTAEMERAHYGLQALLYLAALHRFLRWRLPGYDPDRNLAGASYLFLRGMTGTPGAGVFTFAPSGVLVQAISELLDERSAR